MASVVKEIFGHFPSFLKLNSKKSLWDVINHLPKYGIGTCVIPSKW